MAFVKLHQTSYTDKSENKSCMHFTKTQSLGVYVPLQLSASEQKLATVNINDKNANL